MSMGLWLARTGGGGRSEKQCVLLIIVFLCACASPVACAFLRPFGVAARTLRAAGPRRSLLRGGACSSRRAPATVLKKVHMSCTVLVVASQGNIRPMVSHSFDTAGGVDFRLVKVPAKTAPPNSLRPVFLYEENALPRFAGDLRGAIPEYTTQDVPPSQPLGFIPEVAETFSYWEAASGICNEKGVMIAECTCSSIFGAEPLPKGKALLGYMELTRIALERCSSALDAVELIGSLAERHGFYGNTPSLTGAAESLAIADKHEAWVLHVLPDDTGASAIWAAARVPDGHAAAVTNMFVIRNVDLDDPYNFRYSASMLQVAARLSLWRPGTPLDFTKVYSHGEARHKFYSGRRLWRALSLLDPSQHLPQDYDDLVLRPSYPFAVKPAEPVTSKQLRAIMRDYFQGTPLDLARGAASGPFGIIDRFDGAKACMQPGAPYAAPFERPIGVYRMAYSYICEGFLGEGDTVIWFAPHASVTAVYLPVLSGTARAPDGLACGSIKKIDRACAYWAFRYVKHMALMLFSRCLPFIQRRQRAWEDRAEAILRSIPHTRNNQTEDGGRELQRMQTAQRSEEVDEQLQALAAAVVADWWVLADELMLRFGDGWEYLWDVTDVTDEGRAGGDPAGTVGGGGEGRGGEGEEEGEEGAAGPRPQCRPIAYPDAWLEEVSSGLPPTRLWTREQKAADPRFG